ncbi:MAG: hypothetical protein GYB33_03385 [Gammaproteobacteria bacterium]|uniref:hypothetical protein n=1 Tax=Pseudomaricurvus alcaniphilus TaxID=1166482 RepID=UPI001409B54B|nr:hypothetical protein [Pseudomaricurvus alcaniphilus]MBR9909381.1 hypothetical protein [Gammaproteobacteria bacterium]NHN38317.1 hypothetical protein [Pseudomaricurvus alcaniphilus]
MSPPESRAELPGEIKALAEEIAGYLQTRGFVADTLEGICSWWLVRKRLHAEQLRVQLAVQYLCEQGLVERRQLADGSTIYLSAAGNSDGENIPPEEGVSGPELSADASRKGKSRCNKLKK